MADRLARGKAKFDEVYGEGRSEGLVAMQTGLAQDLGATASSSTSATSTPARVSPWPSASC